MILLPKRVRAMLRAKLIIKPFSICRLWRMSMFSRQAGIDVRPPHAIIGRIPGKAAVQRAQIMALVGVVDDGDPAGFHLDRRQ